MVPITNLDEVITKSQEVPVFLFKHSAICPVSTTAKREVESFVKENTSPVYFLVVQEQRALSNQVEQELGIVHQSPQLLCILNGEVKEELSHYAITAKVMARLVKAYQ
jgi:bacillithiol system protein YtxJ